MESLHLVTIQKSLPLLICNYSVCLTGPAVHQHTQPHSVSSEMVLLVLSTLLIFYLNAKIQIMSVAQKLPTV